MSKQSESALAIHDAAAAAAAFGAAAGAVDDAAAAAFGANRTDLRMIGTLHSLGPLSAGRLSVACELSPAATTTAIQRLVSGGHATRRVDPLDKRRAVVTITRTAARLLESVYGPLGAAGLSQLAEYGAEQLALITEFLRRGDALQRAEAQRIRALN